MQRYFAGTAVNDGSSSTFIVLRYLQVLFRSNTSNLCSQTANGACVVHSSTEDMVNLQFCRLCMCPVQYSAGHMVSPQIDSFHFFFALGFD